MNVAVSTVPSPYPPMFLGAANGSAELASPDTGGPRVGSNESSMANSIESLRDRSHLFLDVNATPKRGTDTGRPSDNLGLFGLKSRKTAAALQTDSKPEPTVAVTSSTANTDAIKSFLGLAQNNLVNSITGVNAEALIAETPTPTRLLYPKNVSRQTEDFAEGFFRHLQQLKETESQKPLESPYYVHTILTPLTPTLTPAHELIRAVLSTLSTPAGTPTGFPGPLVSQPLPEPIVTNATVISPVTSIAPVTTTGVTPVTKTLDNIVSSANSVNTTTALKKTNLMDPMFRQDFNPFMFNHQMPPHSQQNGLQFTPNMSQQQPLNNIKTESSTNYGNMVVSHSTANLGMCQPPPQPLNCSATTSAHQLSNYQGHHSSSSHASEMDMSDQERKKLERKRARNRMAASKCRQRKIERIQQLENEVQQERQRFAALQATYANLERSLVTLQEEIMRHKNSGCVFGKNALHLMSHINNIMNNNGMGLDASI